MLHKNIFAWTAPGFNPEYLSINRNARGRLEITARSPVGGVVDAKSIQEQAVAAVELPDDQLDNLIEALVRERDRV